MDIRDPANARFEALQERADAYKAGGEKVPDHLAKLLRDAEKAGSKTRAETRAEQPKAETAETRDGQGFFYENGHGYQPEHADSTDERGYHVPRPATAAGADPLPDIATSDFDAVEPVEKYPDFANPYKKGDLIPAEAHERGVVPEHLKGKASKPEKAMEKLKEEREAEAEKAHRGEPVDPEKAQNPAPDPHQLAVNTAAQRPPAKPEPPKKAAESVKAASKEAPKGATQASKPAASNRPSDKK
jgi:hypothetical protein